MKECLFRVTALFFMLPGATLFADALFKFDFEPPGIVPASGYTHIDETALYSSSLGYGFLDITGLESRNRGSSFADDRLRDFVNTKKTSIFQIDLANGDYRLNIVAGDPLYATYQRFEVSGNGGTNWTVCGCDDITNTNLNAGPLPYTYIYDSIVIPPGKTHYYTSYRIEAGEHMQARGVPFTVTTGKVLIKSSASTNACINFLEIVDKADCQTLIQEGQRLAGDINGDCYVDFKDFAEMMTVWMFCDDPANDDCTVHW